MPGSLPASDALRLELDILASELDGVPVPGTASPSSLGGAPPEAPAASEAPSPEAAGERRGADADPRAPPEG